LWQKSHLGEAKKLSCQTVYGLKPILGKECLARAEGSHGTGGYGAVDEGNIEAKGGTH